MDTSQYLCADLVHAIPYAKQFSSYSVNSLLYIQTVWYFTDLGVHLYIPVISIEIQLLLLEFLLILIMHTWLH